MLRTEYEILIVKAAKAIHLVGGCPTGECSHHISIYSGEAIEADAAFRILFDHLGLVVPDEIPGMPVVSGQITWTRSHAFIDPHQSIYPTIEGG